MGYSLYLQRCWAQAEVNLRQAIAIRPDHSRAHNNLGLLLAHLDRTDEALAEFRRGGCPPAEAHANVAFAHTMEKRWPQARQHYELALAADPSSAEARKGLQGLDGLAARVDRGYLRAEPAGAVVQASARSPYLPTDPVFPEASSALTRVSLKVPVALEAAELAELKACSATGSQAPASAWPDLAEDRKGLVKMTKAPEDECGSPRMGEADSCHSPPGAVGGEWVW